MPENNEKHQGGCLCEGVRYEVNAPLAQGTACHCSQCTKSTGTFYAISKVKLPNFTFIKDESLQWYKSSKWAERGFCKNCGSNLFYRPFDGDHISVTLGSLDQPTGVKIEQHIFTKFKPDYYEITDGKPQLEIH